jgi:putative addiction module component (TIGR02574 family)
MSIRLDEILELPIAERIRLAQDIWDSVAAEPGEVKLTDEQMAEIDRRLEYHRQHPHDVIPWEEVRDRLRRRA